MIHILGAGPAGLSAAYELSKSDVKCVVLERSSKIGGICRTLSFGEFRTDLGPHRFFSTDPMLYEMIRHLLKDDWIQVNRLTRQCIDGKYYDYPVKLFQALFNVGIFDATRMIFDFSFQKLKTFFVQEEHDNVHDWLTANFGKTLANFNMINYNEKIWGMSTKYISSDFTVQRIKGLSMSAIIKDSLLRKKKKIATIADRFYYPRQGIGQLYDALAKEVLKISEIKMETEAKEICCEKDRITHVDGMPVSEVISSIPITDLVIRLNPNAPDEVIEAAKSLSYRNTIFVFITLDKERISMDNWIYFPTKNVPFIRMMEPKNFSEELSPKGKTSLMVEYTAFDDDDLWNRDDKYLKGMTVEHLERLDFLTKDEVLSGHVVRLKRTYPLWDLGYKRKVDTITDYLHQFKNLYLVGRNGRFQYNNQDHSILTGIEAAKAILTGDTKDLESIGKEMEYQEKGKLYQTKIS